MRSIEDYGVSVEFQKSSTSHHRMPLGKPTPSKWDDAQKWLVNLQPGGDRNKAKAKASPRNSNADDRRLIGPEEEGSTGVNNQCDVETKNVDWAEEPVWRSNNKQVTSPELIVRPLTCLRDMGTEMTPIASQEPSRSTTPVRVGNAAAESRSHELSGSLPPATRCLNELQIMDLQSQSGPSIEKPSEERSHEQAGTRSGSDGEGRQSKSKGDEARDHVVKMNSPLETRAGAWDEAERAKYMARYKREEVKIQAWENHQKRKAEMEYAKIEAKAERLKSGAQEEYKRNLAETQRIAEEKRANAEAKLNEKLMRTSQRADYIRRRGHLPSSSFTFPFKMPSCSWCCW